MSKFTNYMGKFKGLCYCFDKERYLISFENAEIELDVKDAMKIKDRLLELEGIEEGIEN